MKRHVEIIGGPDDGKIIDAADGVDRLAFVVPVRVHYSQVDPLDPMMDAPRIVNVPIERSGNRWIARWSRRTPKGT